MRGLKNKEVLLLGGGGYVGRSLVPHLLDANQRVRILTRRCEGPFTREGVETCIGSIETSEVLKQVLPHCQTIVHLASDSTPGTTGRRPALEAELNIVPTLRFLHVLQEYPDIHLIYLSSGGTVYGNPKSTPVNEKHPLSPISYHGAGKVAIEAFLQVYSNQFQRPVTILRPSNLYGPGQLYREGFGVIRTILEHLRRDTPIQIWGDGEAVRDFIYIEDFIDACKRIIIDKDPGNSVRIYNIGSEKGYSINQLCQIIEETTHKSVRRVYRSGRASDVRAIILDCSKVKSKFGWEPSTNIEKGIELTWGWMQNLPL